MELRTIEGIEKKHVEKLEEHWITTSEQLVAISAVEGGKEGLAKLLEATLQEVSDVVKKVEAHFPRMLAMTMTEEIPEKYALGALKPPSERRMMAQGPFESIVSLAELPVAVDYSRIMPSVRSQGARGTCVAFATTALNEYLFIRRNKHVDLSEQFLYCYCKRNDGYPNECGTFVSVGMEGLQKEGQCREEFWPYNPNPPCNQPCDPPDNAINDAANYKVDNVTQLKQHLQKDM
ncbi:MAG: C1 family peptidase [Methanosarcinales archaeon]